MSNKLILKNVEKIEFTNNETLPDNIGRQPFCQCTNVQQDYSSNYANETINYNQYHGFFSWLQYDLYPTIKASPTHSADERDMWRLFNEWTTTGAINTDTSRYTISTDGITVLEAGYYRFNLQLYAYNPFAARRVIGCRLTKLPSGGTEAFVGPVTTTGHIHGNALITEEAAANDTFAGSASLSTVIACSANDKIRLRTIRVGVHDSPGKLTYTPPAMSELRCEFISEVSE